MLLKKLNYKTTRCAQHSETKTTGLLVTKLGRWIVDDMMSWSTILFEIKRSNVKVGVSLHSFECQSSSSFVLFFC